MLPAEPTAMGAGVILWGDARDPASLHGTMVRMAGAAPPHFGGVMMAPAYDVRHASEGIREKKSFGDVVSLAGPRRPRRPQPYGRDLRRPCPHSQPADMRHVQRRSSIRNPAVALHAREKIVSG
jgi:hypothetical protein